MSIWRRRRRRRRRRLTLSLVIFFFNSIVFFSCLQNKNDASASLLLSTVLIRPRDYTLPIKSGSSLESGESTYARSERDCIANYSRINPTGCRPLPHWPSVVTCSISVVYLYSLSRHAILWQEYQRGPVTDYVAVLHARLARRDCSSSSSSSSV